MIRFSKFFYGRKVIVVINGTKVKAPVAANPYYFFVLEITATENKKSTDG